MEIKFIIFAPHSYCKNDENPLRHCDRRALKEAHELKNIIESGGHMVDFFQADRFRSEIDYNRSPARTYDIRIKFRELVKKYYQQGYYVIVFEMHSFPGKLYQRFGDADIGFFSIPRYEKDMYFLADYLRKKINLKISPLQSKDVNDIQWDTSEVAKNNISHYLIEFNEDDINKKFPNLHQTILEGALERLNLHKKKGGAILYTINIYYIFIILVIVLVILVIYYYSVENDYLIL